MRGLAADAGDPEQGFSLLLVPDPPLNPSSEILCWSPGGSRGKLTGEVPSVDVIAADVLMMFTVPKDKLLDSGVPI